MLPPADRFHLERRLPVKLIALLLLLPVIAWGAGPADNDADFDGRLRTEHFDFRFPADQGPAVRDIARFAEGFLAVLQKDFFDPKFDYPIKVLVLPTREAFQGYLRSRLKVADPPAFGIYLGQLKAFVTYSSSGLGTFAHEIMHPLVERNLPKRPAWANEGIPSFFEKFLGYWDGDALVLRFGYQNPWRIQALGDQIDGLDLKSILQRKANDYGTNRNSDLRMVSVFLWRNDKFHRYLELLRRGDKGNHDTYLEAAFRRPLKEIEPMWRRYLRDAKANRAEIYRIPASTVFKDKAAYESFIKEQRLEVQY